MQNRGWRKSEPLDNILLLETPALFADAVDVLLTNNVFTPQEFIDELSVMGLAMNADELETLLNLAPNTLEVKKEKTAKIVTLKNIGIDT